MNSSGSNDSLLFAITFEVSHTRRILTLILGMIITIENTLNIIIICIFPSLRSKTNYVLLSLAMADMIAGATLMVQQFLPQTERCLLGRTLMSALTNNSAVHLAIVTMERYLAILHPLHYDIYFTKTRLVLCLLTYWSLFIILVFVKLCVVLTGLKPDEKLCNKFNVNYAFHYIHVCTITCVSLVLVFMYVKIFREIKKQNRRVHDLSGSSASTRAAEVKVIKTLVITVGWFMVCWWPLIVCIIVGMVYKESSTVPPLLSTIIRYLVMLVFLNSGMNPIIYFTRMKTFRDAYIKLFRCDRCETLPTDVVA